MEEMETAASGGDEGPHPTNGPPVEGAPTFQMITATLDFLQKKVEHHHDEYNKKHAAGGNGTHEKHEEHKDEHKGQDPAPKTIFLKNKLTA